MTISIKRARQRAKGMAAEIGSHQKALDVVAREAGFDTWSAMRAAAGGTVDAESADAGESPLDPLASVYLSRSPEVREAGTVFMRRAFGREFSYGLVEDVLARDMVARRLGEDPALLVVSGMLANDAADLMTGWMDESNRLRNVAHVLGRVFDSSWEQIAVSAIAGAATSMGIDPIEVARFRADGAVTVAEDMIRVIDRIALYERDPAAFGREHQYRSRVMPDDFYVAFLLDAVPADGRVTLLSWQADLMSQPDFHLDELAVLRLQRSLPASVFRAVTSVGAAPERLPVILSAVFGVTSDDHGVLGGVVVPQGDGVFERWLRDAVAKASRGVQPFAFNPLTSSAHAGGLMGCAASVLSMSREDDPAVRAIATEFLADVCRLVMDAGVAAAEIGAGDASGRIGPPSLVMARRVLLHVSHDPDQLVMFAMVRGGFDASSLQAAVDDRRVFDAALSGLDVFADPLMAIAAS